MILQLQLSVTVKPCGLAISYGLKGSSVSILMLEERCIRTDKACRIICIGVELCCRQGLGNTCHCEGIIIDPRVRGSTISGDLVQLAMTVSDS